MRAPAERMVMGFVVAAGISSALQAQSMTEYGSMASKSATVGKRANHISKSIGGVWGSLDKTIQSQGRGSSDGAQAAQTRAAQRAPIRSRRKNTHAAAAIHEDPRRIPVGAGYEEVIRRFGPASYEVSTGPGTKTMAYASPDGGVDVELLDGRVVRVSAAATEEAAVAGPK